MDVSYDSGSRSNGYSFERLASTYAGGQYSRLRTVEANMASGRATVRLAHLIVRYLSCNVTKELMGWYIIPFTPLNREYDLYRRWSIVRTPLPLLSFFDGDVLYKYQTRPFDIYSV